MRTHADDVAARIADHADRFTGEVARHLEADRASRHRERRGAERSLEQQAHETAEILGGHVDAFDERAETKAGEITQQLEELISRIDTGLETRAKALNDALAMRALEVARVLGEGGREVTSALDGKAQRDRRDPARALNRC